MREILFRGKLRDGRWAEGNLEVRKDGVFIITPDETPLGCYGAVFPETVGQYTGLIDKNGKKIFEGDILRIRNDKENPVLVVFRDFGWVCVMENHKYYRHRLENNSGKYEVVGNIHDNPEERGLS